MITIPKGYYTKEKEVKLTESEIEMIIDELERVPHNLFEFMNYKRIIEKLRNKK